MLVLLKALLTIRDPGARSIRAIRTVRQAALFLIDGQQTQGMNHNSFTYDVAPDGTTDGWVLVDDLKPEITQEGAITSITEFAAHFLDFCQR